MLRGSLLPRLLPPLVVLLAAGCARDPRPPDERIRDALADRLRQYEIHGASVAVVLPDDSVLQVCAGVSHDSVMMAPHMLFATGSITKNVVAALILQLAEEGRLSLDDALGRWLPPMPQIDSAITIRQMLGHTSGIFMFWENQKLWDDLIRYRDSVFTPEVVLSYLKEPDFAPGKGFRYSNTNYLLLAMIATRATGSTLSAELRRRFWGPLGLKSTFLSMEEVIPADRLAHVWGDNFEGGTPMRDITFLPRASHESITYGSSGIFSTAADLALWCSALFRGRVLRPASLTQMLMFNRAAAGSWCEGYGFGVFLMKKSITDGETAYGHGGGNIGTSAYMAYLPEYQCSMVVMINRMHGPCPDRMLEDVVEIVVDHLQRNTRKNR